MAHQAVTSRRDQVFEDWFKHNYLLIILGFLFLFISLSLIAPILLKYRIIFPAKVIYWIDGFFCHQLPFRSWFLFGDQAFYPLADAGIKNVISFEDYFHPSTMNYGALRSITGNEQSGFKLAICQRDIAMYSSLFIFSLIFAVSNHKIKKLPLWIWIIFGVLPLALDGGLQLLENLNSHILASLTHESTPFLRTFTGSLFGLLTGWYIFPALHAEINKEKST